MKQVLNTLHKLQQELKAPKDQKNDYGNYKYRSAESILESLKPLLAKYNAVLTLSDKMLNEGMRYHIEATATLYDLESGESISTTACAREADSRKGMDDAQVTGSTSSYARKYALNGLFCIDDTKDLDTNEFHKESKAKKQKAEEEEKQLIGDAGVEYLETLIIETNTDPVKVLGYYKVDSLNQLTVGQYESLRKELEGRK